MNKTEFSKKKIKRIKIFNELLLAFGRGKIIVKEMNEGKHLTLSLRKEIIDIHETIEGKEKSYLPIEQLDLRKFFDGIREVFQKEAPLLLKEIDINDPKFREVEVLISPKKENYLTKTEIKARTLIVKENLEDLIKSQIVKMKNLPHYDFEYAFLVKDKNKFILNPRNDRYFLIKFDDLEMLLNQIVEKSKISDE